MTPEKRQRGSPVGQASLILPQQGQCEWTTNRVSMGSRQTAALRSPAGLYVWTDARTDKKAPGDLPIGMTTPKTATVRFSPKRKCSLPAEERDGTRETSQRESEKAHGEKILKMCEKQNES